MHFSSHITVCGVQKVNYEMSIEILFKLIVQLIQICSKYQVITVIILIHCITLHSSYVIKSYILNLDLAYLWYNCLWKNKFYYVMTDWYWLLKDAFSLKFFYDICCIVSPVAHQMPLLWHFIPLRNMKQKCHCIISSTDFCKTMSLKNWQFTFIFITYLGSFCYLELWFKTQTLTLIIKRIYSFVLIEVLF